MHRRQFVATAGMLAGASALRAKANRKLVLGVMGCGDRGTSHAVNFAKLPDVEVAYVCDVDKARAEKAAKAVQSKAKQSPKVTGDFRTILDDKSVDALVCATGNHWHAPAAILACRAGKHVYVEKPCSHNPWEGEMLVAAARQHDRLVQMGNQRRSWPALQEAMQKIREGVIGRTYLAQSWYTNTRKSIGKGKLADPPEGLDYELWQGPAPRRPFRTTTLHYTWHWFWHWGNGELGNNGVHTIDVARWGLGAEYPEAVSSTGGKFRFGDDDQETPDTHVVGFDLPDRKAITWEGLSCNKLPQVKQFDVQFVGENGSLSIHDKSYTISDLNGKEIGKGSGPGGDKDHLNNFLAAIRGEAKLNSPISDGHCSTLYCHLGNIAHRTGRRLKCDPADGKILNDPEAMQLWKRQYEPGWEPNV